MSRFCFYGNVMIARIAAFAFILLVHSVTRTHSVPLFEERPVPQPAIQQEYSGAQYTKPNEFPWMVNLEIKFASPGITTCGGSLVANQWILTAAHCVHLHGDYYQRAMNASTSVIVRLGKDDLFRFDEEGEETRKAIRIIPHSNFDPETYNYDFALIEMDAPVSYTRQISPVSLPRQEQCSANYYDARSQNVDGCYSGVATGWGIAEYGEWNSKWLKKVTLNIRPMAACAMVPSMTGKTRQFSGSKLCAGGLFGQDTCKGDSGGPFICNGNDGRSVQIGVTSYGDPECSTVVGTPAVYGRVCSVLPWILSIISNTDVTCLMMAMPSIENGFFQLNATTFAGETRAIYCNRGYTLLGDKTITCLPNGLWSEPRSQCIRQDGCWRSPLPTVQNGDVSLLGGSYVGSIRTISCNEGYYLVGEAEIACLPSGVWSQPDADCVTSTDCRNAPLPNVPNGVVQRTGSYNLGAARTIYCNPGYSLVGTNGIYCLITGNWTRPNAQCKPQGSCSTSPLPEIKNGFVMQLGNYDIGSYRMITCNSGYKLFGNSFITCQLPGVWSQPGAECRKECQQSLLPRVANGVVDQIGDTAIGSTRVITCNEGYTREGDAVVICTPSATWSQPTTECRLGCSRSQLPRIQNGSIQQIGSSIVGATRFVTCDQGFRLYGSPFVTCTRMGSWTQPSAECRPPECQQSQLPGVPNGFVQQIGSFVSGSMRKVSCYSGFVLYGDSNVICLASGNWSRPNSQCRPRGSGCELAPLPSLPNGFVQQGGRSNTGALRNIYCNWGYVLYGESTVKCLEAGYWSNPRANCRKPSCDGFACHNGICVDSNVACDGYDDCGDQSDEYDCQITHRAINTIPCAGFQCANGRCILSDLVCNNIDNCGDQSDERCPTNASDKVKLQQQLGKAADYGNVTEVGRLLALGYLDVNWKQDSDDDADDACTFTVRGSTALHRALRCNEQAMFDVVRLLLNAGADTNVADLNGETPLIMASYYGQSETVRLLIDRGANVDAKGKNGETALMVAATAGYSDIVRLLLDHGAETDVKDDRGLTALAKAEANNRISVVRLLRSRGRSK